MVRQGGTGEMRRVRSRRHQGADARRPWSMPRQRWGRIDILHYNVGVSIAGGDAPLAEITEEAFDRICDHQLARRHHGLQARASRSCARSARA